MMSRLGSADPTRTTEATCSCGRKLRFRFCKTASGEKWEILAYDPFSSNWVVVDRHCPTCGQSFAELSADEIKDRLWVGGMIQ